MAETGSEERSRAALDTASIATTARVLVEALSNLFDPRSPEWRKPDRMPHLTGVGDIPEGIRSVGRKNFIIGLEGTCETPLGAFWPPANPAEVVMILANQLQMVHAIGQACGIREEVLGRELLLGVLFQGIANAGGGGLLEPTESGLRVRKPTDQQFSRVLTLFAEAAARSLARAGIARSWPSVGPAILAAWGFFTTEVIGNLARDLLTKEIVVSSPDEGGTSAWTAPEAVDPLCEVEKTKVLINLLKNDQVPDARKSEVMTPFLQSLPLPAEEIHRIERRMADSRLLKTDFAPFLQKPWRRIDLLLDLIGLSLMDQKMNTSRTRFIQEIGQGVGFAKVDMDWVLEEEVRAKAFKIRLLVP